MLALTTSELRAIPWAVAAIGVLVGLYCDDLPDSSVAAALIVAGAQLIRINRLFTQIFWGVAALPACAVLIVWIHWLSEEEGVGSEGDFFFDSISIICLLAITFPVGFLVGWLYANKLKMKDAAELNKM